MPDVEVIGDVENMCNLLIERSLVRRPDGGTGGE